MTNNSAKPLNILVGGDYLPNPDSGAAGTVYQMNQAFRRLGHSVDEIWADDLRRRIRHGNLHCLLELPWSFRRQLRSKCATKGYDIIELNQPHVHAAAKYVRDCEPGTVFVNRSHGHEVRVRETLHEWGVAGATVSANPLRRAASRIMTRLLHDHWRLICRFADGFHVSSRDDADFLSTRYQVPPTRIGLIPQGISEPFICEGTHPKAFSRFRRLIYVGQFAPFKGPAVLAAAVSEILLRNEDAEMTWICGEPHHDSARSLLVEKIRPRVTFRPWMTQELLIHELDHHGLFLFPSFCEGFGKAPLEAMARELCVVASNTGGMRDYIQHQQNGVLVPVGNPRALAEAVSHLLNNPQEAARLAVAGRRTAMAQTWDFCAQVAVDFYRRLLDVKSRDKIGHRVNTCES